MFLVSTWVITLANNPKSLGLFFFHPILQSLSISIFAYGALRVVQPPSRSSDIIAHSGILTLQPTSQVKTKAAGLTRHQLAMAALGVPAIFLGTLAIIWNKYIHESAHFKTWHGVSSGRCSLLHPHVDLAYPAAIDPWYNIGGLVGRAGRARRRQRMVRRSVVRRRSEGEARLEIPPVSDEAIERKVTLTSGLMCLVNRFSGYLLFPLFLLTAYLGGGWSSWTTSHSPFVVRLLAYTISPVVLIAAVLVRVRCVFVLLTCSSSDLGGRAWAAGTLSANLNIHACFYRTSKMQFF